MIHYTQKNTGEVFAYENDEQAQAYDNNYDSLVLMTDEQFDDFINNKPIGGKWTIDGWIIDDELVEKYNQGVIASQQSKKTQLLAEVKEEIEILNDAIDFGEQDDGDEAFLVELKKYRVQLNKVDTSIINCEFPDKPIKEKLEKDKDE